MAWNGNLEHNMKPELADGTKVEWFHQDPQAHLEKPGKDSDNPSYLTV